MKLEQEKQFNATDDAVKSIVEMYNLEFVAYTAATSGIENTTLIVTAKTQRVVVRIYRLDKKSTQEINLELDFMRHLHDGGVKVPRILPNQHRERISNFEYADATWQIIVMEYIAGEHAQKYSPTLLVDMAKTQATMHMLSSTFSTTAVLSDEFTTLKETYFLPDIDTTSITNDVLLQFLQRASEYTTELDTLLPKGLCHLDYDKDNIMAQNEHIVAVLDFDDMAIAPFVVCLGYTLWHVWRYAGKDMVDTYVKEYEKIRPLGELEKQYLTKVILFRHYMISDLKILNTHTSQQDTAGYIELESEISASTI